MRIPRSSVDCSSARPGSPRAPIANDFAFPSSIDRTAGRCVDEHDRFHLVAFLNSLSHCLARSDSMRLDVYVNYRGTCEEAFRFYEKHLGGKMTGLARHG